MAVENEIIALKDTLVSKLESIEKALLKLLDFYAEEVKGDTIAEIYDLTTKTAEQKIDAPVFDGKRMHWFWIEIDNFDSENDVKIGINGDSDTGILVKAGKTKTLGYGNLKVDFLQYRAVTGTPAIQIICLRPRYQGK